MAQRETGTVKWFNPIKGYGFILYSDKDGEPRDVFVHFSAVPGEKGYRNLEEGQRVSFTLGDNGKGPCATKVEILNPVSAQAEVSGQA